MFISQQDYSFSKFNLEDIMGKTPIHLNGLLNVLYSMKKCIELKKQYEKENNFEYDKVVLTRIDIDIKCEFNIPVSDCLQAFCGIEGDYGNHNGDKNYIYDTLIFGPSIYIDVFENLYENIYMVYDDLRIIHGHVNPFKFELVFSRYLVKNNIPYVHFSVPYDFINSRHRGIYCVGSP